MNTTVWKLTPGRFTFLSDRDKFCLRNAYFEGIWKRELPFLVLFTLKGESHINQVPINISSRQLLKKKKVNSHLLSYHLKKKLRGMTHQKVILTRLQHLFPEAPTGSSPLKKGITFESFLNTLICSALRCTLWLDSKMIKTYLSRVQSSDLSQKILLHYQNLPDLRIVILWQYYWAHRTRIPSHRPNG